MCVLFVVCIRLSLKHIWDILVTLNHLPVSVVNILSQKTIHFTVDMVLDLTLSIKILFQYHSYHHSFQRIV